MDAQTLSSLLSLSPRTVAERLTHDQLSEARTLVDRRLSELQPTQLADSVGLPSRKPGRSRWDSDSEDEKIKKKVRKSKASASLPRHSVPFLSATSCRSLNDFELSEALNEGTYGEVFKATRRATGEVVALKRIKFSQDKWEGFPLAALRETNVLFTLRHANLVKAHEMVISASASAPTYPEFDVYMVMDFYEMDLYELMHNKMPRNFHQSEVKLLLHQLLAGVAYMHERWYMHRDLKLTNILYAPGGRIVICDFGLAKQFTDPPKAYTTEVVTLHYRSPELLLNVKDYDGRGVDLWSIGCIFAELLTKETLLPGENAPGQLNQIWHYLGTPTPEPEPWQRSWPIFGSILSQLEISIKPQNTRRLRERIPATSPLSQTPYLTDVGMSLLEAFLVLDPSKRISATDALSHAWFTTEAPAPKELGQMIF